MRFLILIILVLSSHLSATIINIPADYQTIQEGIDVSIDGDTVLIQPDTYYENINFNGHNITLGSLFIMNGDTNYISQTVIDGNQNGSVMRIENEDLSVISGFTITNGNASSIYPYNCGGGLYSNNSSPTISNCVFVDNIAFEGAGLFITNYSSPLLKRVKILSNVAIGDAGGILITEGSNPTVYNTKISNNVSSSWGGGIKCNQNCITHIEDSEISNNRSENHYDWGGGIVLSNGTLSLVNVTMVNNISGGIVLIDDFELFITNSILVTNQPSNIMQYSGWDGGGSINISYSNYENLFQPNEHTQYLNNLYNIILNPNFVNPDNSNYTLLSNSPCIDSGNPNSPLDPDCTIADMGAYFFNQSEGECPILGDVNGDCEMNVVDVVMIVFCILDQTDECECGDMDGDGEVNIFDIVWAIDLILNS